MALRVIETNVHGLAIGAHEIFRLDDRLTAFFRVPEDSPIIDDADAKGVVIRVPRDCLVLAIRSAHLDDAPLAFTVATRLVHPVPR